MKTILTTAVVLANIVAMGSVASAQYGCYHGGGYGYGRVPHYAGFKAIPVGRLPSNVIFKAIQTDEGVVIIAVPQGIGGGSGPVNNGPVNGAPANNVTPPTPNPAPPAPAPQVQPQPQAQVAPASVATNTTTAPSGPASPFFNIPEQTVPSSNFNNGRAIQPTNFQPSNFSSGGGFNNGGFNGGGFNGGGFNGGGGGAVVSNGGNRAPNLVNGAGVRNAPALAPPTKVNNGASRFEFRAPPTNRR